VNLASAIGVGSFLPDIELPGAPHGTATPLRRGGRAATVVVRVHDATCRDCRRYLADLAASKIDLAWWEGRVVVVVPGPLEDASGLRGDVGSSFTVLGDAHDRARLVDGAGVIVADRYGHIYDVADAGDGHALPSPKELEEWLRFLAMQCPE
jgi:hypothetical protein